MISLKIDQFRFKAFYIRFFCFLLTISFFTPGHSQDSSWETVPLSSEVSIDMGKNFTIYDTSVVKVFTSQVGDYELQAKYLTSKYEVHNGDQVVQAYEGFLRGYLPTPRMAIFNNTVSDTSINGTTGKWVHSIYSKDSVFGEMYTYIVLVNSHFYMATIASSHPITLSGNPVFSKYYTSFHFPRNIKEFSSDFVLMADSYRRGQRIGIVVRTITPYFLAVCLVIIIGVLVYRKVRARKAL